MLVGLKYGTPRWLVEAVGQHWNLGLIYDLRDVPGFDHLRVYKNRVVISQVYEANERLGAILAKLAGQGIRVRLWGISPYWPGHTFSLVIWRAEDEELAKEIMNKMHEPFASDKCEGVAHRLWT